MSAVPTKSGRHDLYDRRIEVTCEGCGKRYEITARAARERRSGRCSKLCNRCARWGPRVVDMTTDGEREFWLRTFTLRELIDLANAIWGPCDPLPTHRLVPWAMVELRVRGEVSVADIPDLGI